MATDEIGRLHQIGRADRFRPKPQMGNGLRTGFLGVVDEIPLGVKVGIVADDLDRVLVGADRAVRAQPIKHGPHHFIGLDHEVRIDIQTGVGHIVDDADGKMVLGLVLA